MNRRGVALLMSYVVIIVLTILGSAFVVRSVSESNIAKSYANSTRAFWVAEAGLSQAYYNWANSISQPIGTVNYGGGTYTIDTSGFPVVAVTGTFGGSSRTVQGSFILIPGTPPPLTNTMSIGGNLNLSGLLARVEVFGKTRISGTYSSTWGASGWFEDMQQGVSQDSTTISIPDYNNNGTPDEFSDFVLFGQEAVQAYPADEVVYIQSDGTVNIFPDESLVGKKVIFVEGSTPGAGDVHVFFDGTWQEEEDLTIISTGTISYIQPLQYQADARLSTISWDDYTELSIFRSQHESVMYAHDDANFVDILEWGSTTGNVVVNDDVSLREVLTFERYFYSDRCENGDLPPGFEFLSSSGTPSFADWQESP